MELISLAEDHELAKAYADALRAKPRCGGTWEQVYLGARGELALARLLAGVEPSCLDMCRKHLVREATAEDFKRDLPLGSIDVKVTTGKNRGLVVNRLHHDVRYAVLHTDLEPTSWDAPRDVGFEFVGWLPGAPEHFEPFRLDPKKSYAEASKLRPFNELYPALVRSAREAAAKVVPITSA